MLADKIAAEDLTLPLDQYMDFREAFRTAADRLVADATKLSNVRQLVQGLIDFAESVDANEELSREQYVSAVKDLGTATGQATARIIGSGFVGAAALHEVVNDRDAALRFALKMAPFLETTKAEEA